MKNNKVYIVHCVDTEGPMHESIEATFLRLKNIFGIDFEPNQENLRKLQLAEYDLGGLEVPIANLVAPKRIHMNKNWIEIDEMLARLNKNDFRYALTDDLRRPWIFTWFCLDHVGFSGLNPRNRSLGDHQVFDRYSNWVRESPYGDTIQWHYHPLPATGNVHDSGVAYLTSNNIWEILSKKIIQRNWFPTAYRPGFHTIRPDSHWFLEQWIPFDYGNQSSKAIDTDQPDLADGRYGDWRRAPNNWDIYHPHHDDYQSPGSCRRWIARCMNVEARLRQLSDLDIELAFQRSLSGKDTILAMTNHDFRDIQAETMPVIERIRRVMLKYPEIEVVPTDAVSAMRSVLNLDNSKVLLDCQIIHESANRMRLQVSADGKLFGTQPYLAIELDESKYLWENFDMQEKDKWNFVFDNNHIPADRVTAIGVAANSTSGHTTVANYRRGNASWLHYYYEA
jgi:hypothetical protein